MKKFYFIVLGLALLNPVNFSIDNSNKSCQLSREKRNPVRKIYIVANHFRADAIQSINKITQWLINNGHEVYADKALMTLVPKLKFSKNIFSGIDLTLAFGGDGTIIRAAHACADHGIPILGIDFGHLAFMSQVTPENLLKTLKQFLNGKLKCENRMMVQARVMRQNQVVGLIEGFNEINLHRHSSFHALTLKISINDQFLTNLVADGMIISTPVGSTGYNLSTGGPIIDPHLNALTFSAIAPHSLSARPIVLAPDSIVEITLLKGEKAILSGDGQKHLSIMPKDIIYFSRSPKIVRLICSEHQHFLKKIKENFYWANRQSVTP